MLIPSSRHRARDLAIWREQERGDLAATIPPGRKTRAISAIEEFVHRDSASPCYAGVSWGKDSVVVAHLLWLHARDVPLMHLRPTNHNPDTDAVRDAYFRDFPGQRYDEIAVDYSDLDRLRLAREEIDRLTDERWYAAIREYDGRGRDGGMRRILGIRSGEGRGRLIRMMRWGEATKNALAPIGFWSTHDVFAYIAQNGLPAHPAYAMNGAGRWPRERLRVAEIGDTHGTGGGRREWELEFYGDVLRRVEAGVTA